MYHTMKINQTKTIFFQSSSTFSLPVPTKPVSPYGVYNGQVRSCVYQPTEIALIAKGLTKVNACTILDTTKHLFVVASEIMNFLFVSTDGPRCYDPSSHSSLFESRKWQLPATFGRVLPILIIVTHRHC